MSTLPFVYMTKGFCTNADMWIEFAVQLVCDVLFLDLVCLKETSSNWYGFTMEI